MRIKDVRVGREYLLRVPTGGWSVTAVYYRVRVRERLAGGRVRLEPQAYNVPEYASARSLRENDEAPDLCDLCGRSLQPGDGDTRCAECEEQVRS